MNVAVTRAKRFVCIVGDSETISSNEFLSGLVKYFYKHGEVKTAFDFQHLDENISFNTGFIQVTANEQHLVQKFKDT